MRIPKYVVSATLTDAEAAWGPTTVIGGDVAAEVAKGTAKLTLTESKTAGEGVLLLTYQAAQPRRPPPASLTQPPDRHQEAGTIRGDGIEQQFPLIPPMSATCRH